VVEEEARKEEARKQAEREVVKTEDNTRPDPVHGDEQTGSPKPELSPSEPKMDVDETVTQEVTSKQDGPKPDESERKDDTATMQADDEDAVEY